MSQPTSPATRRSTLSVVPPSRPPRTGHIVSLDGLRGIAVAGVLLFHTGHLRGGFLGVDLFFVLSGFLITSLLLREMRGGSISLTGFWARRLRRLFPALAAMLGAVTLTVWGLERAGAAIETDLVRTTLADGFWVQVNLANWHLLAQDAGYWEAFGQARVFSHLWSVAVEEQFYLVWPILLIVALTLVRRRSEGTMQWAVLSVCGVLAAASLALMVLLYDPADSTRVYTGTDTRAFSLLLGAAAATAPLQRCFAALLSVLGRAAGAVLTVLVAALLTPWFLVDGTSSTTLFTGGLFLHALAAAALIGMCAAAHARTGRTPRPLGTVLEAPPLRWLGQISYSLYLWHWPVIVLLPPERASIDGTLHTVVVLGLSVALAAASTHLVENPLRFRAGWTRGRAGALLFVLVSLALLGLWSLLPEPAGPQIDIGNL